MYKRKLQLFYVLIFSLTILLSGCNKGSNETGKEHEELKKENTTLAKQNSKLEGKYEELEEQIEVLKQELNDLTSSMNTKEVDNDQNNKDEAKETISLYSYTKDLETQKIKEGVKTTITSKATLQEKLNLLASHISQQHFNGLPLIVESIEDNNAVIKLVDDEKNYTNSWTNKYFSNEANYELNSACLIESFLQRNYDGDWVETIEFVYDGPKGWKNGFIQELEDIYDR